MAKLPEARAKESLYRNGHLRGTVALDRAAFYAERASEHGQVVVWANAYAQIAQAYAQIALALATPRS